MFEEMDRCSFLFILVIDSVVWMDMDAVVLTWNVMTANHYYLRSQIVQVNISDSINYIYIYGQSQISMVLNFYII